MWCVVVFKDDNSVEAVPSHWYKNQKCAWPRKNAKKMITCRSLPNILEFDYLEARKLSNKSYDTYTIARNKAKISEMTSDLSTTELSESTQNLNHAKKTKRRKIEKKKKLYDEEIWSPASDDYLIIEQEDINTVLESNTSMELNTVNVSPTDSTLQTNNTTSGTLNVKRKLSYDVEHNSLPKSSKIQNGPEFPSTTIIFSSSSPFKVTTEENIVPQSVQPLQMENTCVNRKKKNLFDLSADNQPAEKLLDLSADYQPAQKDKVLELMNRMNRTMCNIKYDIMSLSDKIDNFINNSEKTGLGFGEMLTDEDTFQKEIFQILPIENEEDLSLFESKLSNQEFRKKITLELKRYAKDSLPSTVRAVMRFLFKDKLLNIFSYKGQKGKKVFYTLTICSVIFDSIKLMKKFSKFDTIEVEGPLKIFISGAKFRDVPKTKTIQSMKD